jgi:hypothetical protein
VAEETGEPAMSELTGTIHSTALSMDGKPLITFMVNEYHDCMKVANKLTGQPVSIKVKKKTEKRSLDANAYYWSLLNKLANVLKISNNYCHNVMLRRYGVLEEIDGKPWYVVIPDTEEAEKTADEADKYHIKPTSNVREGSDGIMYRTYLMLKGSHEYDTAEMSRLISGLVDECKQCGIETLSPLELARLTG